MYLIWLIDPSHVDLSHGFSLDSSAGSRYCGDLPRPRLNIGKRQIDLSIGLGVLVWHQVFNEL